MIDSVTYDDAISALALLYQANKEVSSHTTESKPSGETKDITVFRSLGGAQAYGMALNDCIFLGKQISEGTKPGPKWVPWSFEDQLCGTIITPNGTVGHSKSSARIQITDQDTSKVYTSRSVITYETLLSQFVQLDGTPCGKQVME